MDGKAEIMKICLQFWGLILSFLNTAVLIGIAYFTYHKGFKNWQKQKEEEKKIGLYNRKIEAFKAVWALLEYYTIRPNSKNFISKIDEENQPKKYFLHAQNAREFIDKTAEIFFKQGHGIFIRGEIRDALFNIRNGAFDLLEKYGSESPSNEGIQIEEKAIRTEMNVARDLLIKKLRDEVTEF